MTRVILVLALIAGSCSVGVNIVNADQTVQKEPQLKTVSFGSSVEEIKEKLKCRSTVNSFYKPVGAVKKIACFGMVLRFDHNELDRMEYTQGFDFSIPISPFENPDLNPPPEIKISTGMTFDSFSEAAELWKSHLIRIGYHEGKLRSLWADEFKFKCYEARFSKYCIFQIFPRAYWNFDFATTKEKKLEKFSAKDTHYGRKWAPSKQRAF